MHHLIRTGIREVARKYSLYRCSGVTTSAIQLKKNYPEKQKRQFHHPTEKNVIISNQPDIVIPNSTLNDYVWMDMEKWADRTAVVCGVTGRGYTYSQAFKMSVAFAACLRNKMKMKDGDIMAIMLPNSPDFVLATLGGAQAGCAITTVNPMYTSEEIARQLKDSNAKIVLTSLHCYPNVKKAIDDLKKDIPIILTELNGSPLPDKAINFADFAQKFDENTDCLKEVRRNIEDTIFLPYSSGTTGFPKGVELSHKNIIANCLQQLSENITITKVTTASHQDVMICVLPFFHIYGLVYTLLSRMATGVKLVTIPKFTPEIFLNAQLKYQGNAIPVAPPMVLFMTNHPLVKQEHLDPIRIIMSGAAPLSDGDINRFLDKANNKNITFMQGYGLTETSPVVLTMQRGSVNYASVGPPVSNTECKIVSVEDEKISLGPRETGELWVRGPQVMKGYLNNPTANEDIFRPGGWMRTGDISYYDENDDFYITDRLKELIKVKAFQVAPAELEGVLRSHPELSDAAVIGVPHEQFGEIPRAFVVKKEKCSPTAENVMDYVAKKVASYKKLGNVTFVDAIPKSAAGKILRRELKKKFT